MHVCICTCTDVFVTMLEWNIKSRLVALRSAPASSSHSARGGRRECTISLALHHNKTVVYIFSGYIQEEAGSPPPPPLSSNHHHHHLHPCIGLFKVSHFIPLCF